MWSFAHISARVVMRSWIFVVFFLVLAPGYSVSAQERIFSAAETCRVKLWGMLDQEWEQAAQRIKAQTQRSQSEIADYERVKTELRESVKYLGVFDPTQDWVLHAGQVAQTIKTSAYAVDDLLNATTPKGYIKNVGRKAFYNGLRHARDASEIHQTIKDSSEKGVLWSASKLLTTLNPVTDGIVRLAENIETAVKMPDNRDKFVNEMDQQLASLDRKIAVSRQRLATMQIAKDKYYEYREEISRYCEDTFGVSAEDNTPGNNTRTNSASAVDCAGLSKVRCRLKKLRAKQQAKSDDQWSDVQSGMSADADRLRSSSETARANYQEDAKRVYADMVAASARAVSATLKEIQERNRRTYLAGRSTNCAESQRKVAAYREWVIEARRSRASGGGANIDASINRVEQNINAEIQAGSRMGCRY